MKHRQQLAIQYQPLERLVPFAQNARTHSDAQVAQIAASIREWGFTNPVLVDEEGTIIAGHGRVLAARKLELQDVPTITLTGLSEAQRRAYVIADNKLALNAGWDTELLAAEMSRLDELGFDRLLTGFSEAELQHMATGWEPSSEPDETEPNNAGLEAVIKVRCSQLDQADVRATIELALKESGIQGARLVD